jgi:hypothetical protein
MHDRTNVRFDVLPALNVAGQDVARSFDGSILHEVLT